MTKPGITAAGKIEIWADNGQHLVLDAPVAEGYILGRSDSNSQYIPDIDLAESDALNKGVSRRHAALIVFHGVIHVVDLNSVNGTFLNGERLPSNEPYVLSTDDQLRLGTLAIKLAQKPD